jgi:hypothetical protein
MTTFACTLTEAQRPDRLAEMGVLGSRVLTADVARWRAVVRFRPDDDTRARVGAFVAAENVCCAFLRMALSDEPDALALTIDGPEGAEPIVQELVAMLAPREPAR